MEKLIVEITVDVRGLVTHRLRVMDFERSLRTVDDPVENALKVVITDFWSSP